MPLIPILRPNTDVAKPGVPALDRERRPNVDARGIIAGMGELADASKLPLVNPGPFVEAAGALGHAIGGALMQTGSVVGALAKKRQDAFDDRIIQEAHADMRVESERLSGFYDTTPETGKWMPETQRGLESVMKKYQGIKGLSSDAQQRLALMGDTWGKTTLIHAQTGAAKAEFRRAASSYDANINASLEARNYDEAQRLAKESEERGYSLPHQTQRVFSVADNQKREDSLNQLIAHNAREARALFAQDGTLSEYKLTDAERLEWLRRAESAAAFNERLALQQINNGMARREVLESKDLAPWLDKLEDSTVEELVRVLDKRGRAEKVNDPLNFERAVASIDAMTPTDDAKGLLAQARAQREIEYYFTGPELETLKERLAKKLKPSGVDAPNVTGPAMALVHEWVEAGAAGAVNKPVMKDGRPVMSEPRKVGTVTRTGDTFLGLDWLNPDNTEDVKAPPQPVMERDEIAAARAADGAKTLRERLEAEVKAGRIKTQDDAADFAAREAVRMGWTLPKAPVRDGSPVSSDLTLPQAPGDMSRGTPLLPTPDDLKKARAILKSNGANP